MEMDDGLDDLLAKLRKQVEEDKRRAEEDSIKEAMKSGRMKDLTRLRAMREAFEKDREADEKAGSKSEMDESLEMLKKLVSSAVTISSATPRRVTIPPGVAASPASGPSFVKMRPESPKATPKNRVRIVPDPVAMFLARLSPETQEMIRRDLIARLAGIMSGLSQHKETEERIADLEMFDKMADKIAEQPEWASF